MKSSSESPSLQDHKPVETINNTPTPPNLRLPINKVFDDSAVEVREVGNGIQITRRAYA